MDNSEAVEATDKKKVQKSVTDEDLVILTVFT